MVVSGITQYAITNIHMSNRDLGMSNYVYKYEVDFRLKQFQKRH